MPITKEQEELRHKLYQDAVNNSMFQAKTPTEQEFNDRFSTQPGYADMVYKNYLSDGYDLGHGKGLNGFRQRYGYPSDEEIANQQKQLEQQKAQQAAQQKQQQEQQQFNTEFQNRMNQQKQVLAQREAQSEQQAQIAQQQAQAQQAQQAQAQQSVPQQPVQQAPQQPQAQTQQQSPTGNEQTSAADNSYLNGEPMAGGAVAYGNPEWQRLAQQYSDDFDKAQTSDKAYQNLILTLMNGGKGKTNGLTEDEAIPIANRIAYDYENKIGDNVAQKFMGNVANNLKYNGATTMDNFVSSLQEGWDKDAVDNVDAAARKAGVSFEDYVKTYVQPNVSKYLQSEYNFDKTNADLLAKQVSFNKDATSEGLKYTDYNALNKEEQGAHDVLWDGLMQSYNNLVAQGDKASKSINDAYDQTPINLSVGQFGFDPMQPVTAAKAERAKNYAADPSKAITTFIQRLQTDRDAQKLLWDNYYKELKTYEAQVSKAKSHGKGGQTINLQPPTKPSDINYSAVGNQILRQFQRFLVDKAVPKSTVGYILQGFAEGDIGTLIKSYTQTQYQRYINGIADGIASQNHGLVVNALRETAKFTSDMPVFGLGGGEGKILTGLVTKGAAKKITKDVAESLTKHYLERNMLRTEAETAAKEVSSRIVPRVLQAEANTLKGEMRSSALNGIGMMSFVEGAENAIRTGTSPFAAEAQQQYFEDVASGKERFNQNTMTTRMADADKKGDALHVLGSYAEGRLHGVISGAAFVPGVATGRLIGGVVDRHMGSLASAAFSYLGKTATNATAMTAQSYIEGNLTGQQPQGSVWQNWSSSFINFLMMDATGALKKGISDASRGQWNFVKNYKDYLNYKKSFGITEADQQYMREHGYGDLVETIDKLAEGIGKSNGSKRVLQLPFVSKANTPEGYKNFETDDRQLVGRFTQKMQTGLLKFLADKNIPEDIKVKYYSLFTGDTSVGVSPVAEARVEKTKFGAKLVTYSPQGDVISEKRYLSFDKARKVADMYNQQYQSEKPRTDHLYYGDGFITEIAADGRAIKTHTYKTDDERTALEQEIKTQRDNDDLLAMLRLADQDNTPRGMDTLSDNELLDAYDGALQKLGYDVDKYNSDSEYKSQVDKEVGEGGENRNLFLDAYKEVQDTQRSRNGRTEIINAFSSSNGIDADYVNRLVDMDPSERSDQEQALMNDLYTFAHDRLFQEGQLHSKQSELDGKRAAEEAFLDNPHSFIDPDVAAGISGAVAKATDEYNAYFLSNPDVAEAIRKIGDVDAEEAVKQLMLDGNLNDQKRAEAVRLLSNLINATAAENGYRERINQRIGEVVQREVSDNTIKPGMASDSKGNPLKGMVYVTLGEKDEAGNPIVYLLGSSKDLQFKDDGTVNLLSTDPRSLVLLQPIGEGRDKARSIRADEPGLRLDHVTSEEDYINEQTQSYRNLVDGEYNASTVAREPAEGTQETEQQAPQGEQQQTEQPQNPPTETPQTEEPKTEESKTEEPKTEEPAEQPQTPPTQTPQEEKPQPGPFTNEQGEKRYRFSSGKDVSVDEHGDPKYGEATPEDAAEDISSRLGDSADGFIDMQIKSREKALDKAQKAKPKESASISEFEESERQRKQAIEDAQKDLDHWNDIKQSLADQRKAKADAEAEAKRKAEEAEKARQQAEQQEKLRQAELANLQNLIKTAKDLGIDTKEADDAVKNIDITIDTIRDMRDKVQQAIDDFNGDQKPYTVGKAVREKWNNAPKLKGKHSFITLQDGEDIEGTYYVVPIEAITPSHDPFNDFNTSEGYPVDDEGRNVNDRNYKDVNERQKVMTGGQDFGSRGLSVDDPTVVQEGAVMSGNGRSQMHLVAAKNGKDTKYTEALLKKADSYGLTAEEIKNSGIEHPHVVFVPDEKLTFDAKTYARFNKSGQMAQSNVEKAISIGRQMSEDDRKAIMGIVGDYGSFDGFTKSAIGVNNFFKELVKRGFILQNEVPRFLDDRHDKDGTPIKTINETGKEFARTILLGTVFDADTIKAFNTDTGKPIRDALLRAINPILANKKMGKDYSLSDIINDAVELVYKARNSEKPVSVESYLRSKEIGGKKYSPLSQILAIALDTRKEVGGTSQSLQDYPEMYYQVYKNDKEGKPVATGVWRIKPEYADDYDFNSVLNRYNKLADDALKIKAEPSQGMFGETQKAPTKEELIKALTDKIGETRIKRAKLHEANNIIKHLNDEKVAVVSTDPNEASSYLDKKLSDGESDIRFSKRTKPAPKKTQKVYKLMRLGKDGKLYPLFIDSAEPLELGQWYDADSPDLSFLRTLKAGTWLVDPKNKTATSIEDYCKAKGKKLLKNPSKDDVNEATKNGLRWMLIEDSKTKNARYGEKRSYKNYGISGDGTVKPDYAMRPGWHAGSLPTMRQIGLGGSKVKEKLRDDHFVWVEGEVPADIDYEAEAAANPQHDIPDHIPTDGYYMKSTNANAKLAQADRVGWYVAGAFKADRIISDKQARDVIDKWNESHPDKKVEYDWKRQSGKDFDGDVQKYVNELYHADAPLKFMRVYHGSANDFDHFDTMHHLSEGEGTQMFGAGTYVADQKDLGKRYAQVAGNRRGSTEETFLFDEDGKPLSALRQAIGRYYASQNGFSKAKTIEALEKTRELYEKDGTQIGVEYADDIIKALKRIKGDRLPGAVSRYLYDVEVPDDDGTNYMDWHEPLTDKQKQMWKKALLSTYKKEDRPEAEKWADNLIEKSKTNPNELTGGDAYYHIDGKYSSKKASRALRKAGFTGIKVHAAYYSGDERYTKNYNYVIFDDKDLKINNKIKFFKTSKGDVFGYVDLNTGKIFIDPKHLDPSLPIHEYGHLWAAAVRQRDPERWKNIVETVTMSFNDPLVKKYLDAVRRDEPDLKGDDLVEEVLMRYSGARGEQRLQEEAKKIWDSGATVDERQLAKRAIDSLKNALHEFWKTVADLLGFKYKDVNQIADHIIYDALNATYPRKYDWKDMVGENGESIKADNRVAHDADDNWQRGKDYLDKNPDAHVADLQKDLHIDNKVANLIWKRWNDEKKQGDGNNPPTHPVVKERPELGEKPLTEDEINKAEVDSFEKPLARAFLSGKNKTKLAEGAYKHIYDIVRGKENKPNQPTGSGKTEPDIFFGANNNKIFAKSSDTQGEETAFKGYKIDDTKAEFEPTDLDRIKSLNGLENAVIVKGGKFENAKSMEVVSRGIAELRTDEASGRKYWEITKPAEIKLIGEGKNDETPELEPTTETFNIGRDIFFESAPEGSKGVITLQRYKDDRNKAVFYVSDDITNFRSANQNGRRNAVELVDNEVSMKDATHIKMVSPGRAEFKDGVWVITKKAKATLVGDGSKRPTEPKKPTGGKGGDGKPGNPPTVDTSSADADVDDLISQFGAASDNKGGLNYSLDSFNTKQQGLFFKILGAFAKAGFGRIQNGLTDKEAWKNEMANRFGEALKKVTGFSDQDVADVFEDVWNSPYEVNGEEKNISDWAEQFKQNSNEQDQTGNQPVGGDTGGSVPNGTTGGADGQGTVPSGSEPSTEHQPGGSTGASGQGTGQGTNGGGSGLSGHGFVRTPGSDGQGGSGSGNNGGSGQHPTGSGPRPRPNGTLGGDNQPNEPGSTGAGVLTPKQKLNLSTEKIDYVAASDPEGKHAIGSVIPSSSVSALKTAFEKVQKETKKTITEFVRDELGYSSDDEMFSHLSSEQVDGVALSLYNMKKGKSFIIGDMTGVGKGRQVASLLRWGVKNKKKVIFVTEKDGLFSDMYRDLEDIGSGDFVPFILNDSKNANITASDGKSILIKRPGKNALGQMYKEFRKTGKAQLPSIPEGERAGQPYDLLMTTYSQFKDDNASDRIDFVKAFGKDAIIVMDESHNASGQSTTGQFMQELVKNAGGVVFASATYAKRPDNMLLYALRSSMKDINMSGDDLVKAIHDYGVPMQEIMATALFSNGEMIRRERDFKGVKTHWLKSKEIYTKEENDVARRTADKTMKIVNDIISFQANFVTPVVERKNQELQLKQYGRMAPKEKIYNTAYSSQVSNVTNLMTYGLKVQKAIDMAVDMIKKGEKPVIAVDNTLESLYKDLGENFDFADFNTIFDRGIDFSLRYFHKYPQLPGKKGKGFVEEHNILKEGDLGSAGEALLKRIRKEMEDYRKDTDKVTLTLSPIDAIINGIEKAGYHCGEITGRTKRLVKKDGKYSVVSYKTDKKEAASRFNGGSAEKPLAPEDQYDCLVINRSGATGISLHASSKFGNQKPRKMIILQPSNEVDKEVQMRGRIDRTGQLFRGEYFYLVSPIPAEQKIFISLKRKLASLDANTVGEQKTENNTVESADIFNKYGDQVAYDYLKENMDINTMLGSNGLTYNNKTGSWEGREDLMYDVAKGLQRLPVETQEKVLDELTTRYGDVISYLNQNGINDLVSSTQDLEATTIDKAVFVKGKDNSSENIFAHDTDIERVEVNLLKKPLHSADIHKQAEKLTQYRTDDQGNRVPKDANAMLNEVLMYKGNALAALHKKQEEEMAALKEQIRKTTPRDQFDTDEGFENYIESNAKVDSLRMKQDKAFRDLQDKLTDQENAVEFALTYLHSGKAYLVPVTDDVDQNAPRNYARFIGFNFGNGNPRNVKAVFAVKDSRARLELPAFGQQNLIVDIVNTSRSDIELQATNKQSDDYIDNWWDRMIPKNTNRTVRYMITGNILQACGQLGKYKGQIVTFTRKNKDTGEVSVDRGMLLAENFDPETFTTRQEVTKDDVWHSSEAIDDTKSHIKVYRQGTHLVVEFSKRNREKLADHPVQTDKEFKGLAINGEVRPSGRDKLVAVIPSTNVEKALHLLYTKYGLTMEKPFVMPDSREKVDRIVHSGRPPQEVIDDFGKKYNIDNWYAAQLQINKLVRRYKMDTTNDALKQKIRDLVQLRQAFLRKRFDQQPDDKLAWDYIIRLQNEKKAVDNKDAREQNHNEGDAILEELESRGVKGTELHLKQGETSYDDVRKLFNSLNKDNVSTEIMDKVEKCIKQLGGDFHIILDDTIDADTGGFQGGKEVHYNWSFMNSKYIPDSLKASTILHELIHVCTSYATFANKNGLEHLLTPEMKIAIDQLQTIFNEIKKDPAFQHDTFTQYGVTEDDSRDRFGKPLNHGIEEMLAEAGSNESFRADLKKAGFWKRIVFGVMKFLGFKSTRGVEPTGTGVQKASAYDEVMERLDYLLENFSAEAWRNYYKQTSYSRNTDNFSSKQYTPEEVNSSADPHRELDRGIQRDGLDKALGHDNYTALMRDIATTMRTADMSSYIRGNVWRNNLDLYKTVQGYFASLADKPGHETMWQDYQDKVNNALKKAGYDVQLGLRQTKYLAWLAEHPSDAANPMAEAERVAMRRKIMSERISQPVENGEYQDFPKEQSTKESTGSVSSDTITANNSVQSPSSEPVISKKEVDKVVESDNALRLFSKPGSTLPPTSTPSQHNAKEVYEKILEHGRFIWNEAHADYMAAAHALVRAITGIKGDLKGVLKENEDFLNGENQLSSLLKDKSDIFQRTIMDPLTETVGTILPEFGKKRKKAMQDLQVYMITKHALERNRIFYVRDLVNDLRAAGKKQEADTLEGDFNAQKAVEDADLELGVNDLQQYYSNLDNIITSLTKKYTKKDFDASKLGKSNGLSVLYGNGKGAYDDAAAIKDVMDIESTIGKDRIKELWDRTEAAARYSIDVQHDAGLITAEQAKKLNTMFQWYIPLRGFDQTMAEDVYPYLIPDYNPKKDVGPVIKDAKGRVSLSSKDVFATIAAMASKSLNNALQNQYVNQRFLNFIHNYYKVDGANRLVTEVKHWIVKDKDPQTGKEFWRESFPDLSKPTGKYDANGDPITEPIVDPKEVEQVVTDWENDMEARKAKGEASVVNEKNTIPYRFTRRGNRSQHVVVAYQNGKKHVLIINGNPRAAEAINGCLRPASGNKIFNKIVRTNSQLVTTYQPDFTFRNTARDAWFAGANNFINEGFDYWRRYVGNYAKVAGMGLGSQWLGAKNKMSVGSLFYRYKKGTLNPNNSDDMYFKEFMENGGETGWMGMEDVKKWQAKITADLKDKKIKKVEDVLTSLPRLLEFANEHAENIARFATYLTSRKMGRSITRSIADAKEVTVNFNRKGAGLKSLDFRTEKDKNGVSTGTKIAARTAQWLRGNIMFYNAGMQGLNTFAKNFHYHPVRSAATTAFFFTLGGMLVPFINNMLQDNDDTKDKDIQNPYAELPEYVRRQNLCLYTGGGNFITVPLPIELRAIYGIGDMAASYTNHPELQNGTNPILDVAAQFSQILPIDPLGESYSSIMAIVPPYIKPFAEAGLPTIMFGGKENGLTEGTNKRWNGMPIRRDKSDWNENAPKWQRAYTSTGDAYVSFAKWLDKRFGKYHDVNVKSKVDIDPAATQHYFESFTGGIATTANNLAALIKEWGQDKSIKDALNTTITSQHTPLLRTLHFKPSENNRYFRTRSKWFAYKDEADKFNADMKQLSKDRANPLAYAKTKSKSFDRDLKISQIMKAAQKAYDAYTKIIQVTPDLDTKNAYSLQRDQIMYDTVDQLDKLK